MKEKLIVELEETTNDLVQTLSSFTQEEFNQIPFEGSWTAGQVAEHLYKSVSRISNLLQGNSKQTERNPFKKIRDIEAIFLDYTAKFKSPDFILPSTEPKDKNDFIKGFEQTKNELKRLAEAANLDRTITDFPFPKMGELTGWEWICFATAHSKRHVRQLKNIAQKIKASTLENDAV